MLRIGTIVLDPEGNLFCVVNTGPE